MKLSLIKSLSLKRKVTILGTAAVILSSVVAVTISQHTQDTRSRASTTDNSVHATGTYTDWNWPSKDYTNFQWQVTPNNEQTGPDAYFYSHQYGFTNGDGGYAGIQGDANGKRAIFSLWNTLDAKGPEIAKPFGGEGVGYQTIIKYPWIAGRTYAFKVERIDFDHPSH